MTNVIDDFDCVTTFDYPYEKKDKEVEATTNLINTWLDDFGWL